jgi:glycosyltransferase involved in cell wall biosynthesis
MKFLVVGPTYPFRGGIAHHTTLLVKHLAKGHQTLLISFKSQYPSFFFPGKTDRDTSREPLRIPCEYRLNPLNPMTWKSVALRAVQFHPDVLILPWWVPFWAPCWWWLSRRIHRATRSRVVFYCHNVLPHEPMPGVQWLSQKALDQGHAFIVQDEPDRILLEEIIRVQGRPVRIILPPSVKDICYSLSDPVEARKTLGLPTEGAVVLFFGFVRPYKGLDILIRAFPKLLELTNAHLLVAGEFWTKQETILYLIDSLQLRDKVTIVDRYIPNEEVGFFFSAADVVALPYRSGTGSAVAQLALGLNRPVIATRVGGLPEVVHDGWNGLLVDPASPADFGNALVRFFRENLKESMMAYLKQANENSNADWAELVRVLSEIAFSPPISDG